MALRLDALELLVVEVVLLRALKPAVNRDSVHHLVRLALPPLAQNEGRIRTLKVAKVIIE